MGRDVGDPGDFAVAECCALVLDEFADGAPGVIFYCTGSIRCIPAFTEFTHPQDFLARTFGFGCHLGVRYPGDAFGIPRLTRIMERGRCMDPLQYCDSRCSYRNCRVDLASACFSTGWNGPIWS